MVFIDSRRCPFVQKIGKKNLLISMHNQRLDRILCAGEHKTGQAIVGPMKKQDYRYEDLGPEYFAELFGGQVLSCERARIHDEHQSSPTMTRWRVTYRKDGGRHVVSFVAKKFRPEHEREIPIYCWLQKHTTVNMPALVDFRNDRGDDNCWMLTENCYNYKDIEYYYLESAFFLHFGLASCHGAHRSARGFSSATCRSPREDLGDRLERYPRLPYSISRARGVFRHSWVVLCGPGRHPRLNELPGSGLPEHPNFHRCGASSIGKMLR